MPPRRVLLVDDHEDTREMLAQLCLLRGHDVATASNGRDAIALTRSFQPAVAFIDLGLPELDGYAVARELRMLLGPACPRLIALSGWTNAQERALHEGFDEYVRKPISMQLLEECIGRS